MRFKLFMERWKGLALMMLGGAFSLAWFGRLP